ncbi:MAG: hypothetical protein A2W91_18810 [Bacteroidetes bacterium GWF2_38_335]|nr:MAG: hypothetical protein A2W91_18810 [Bacteroidetes bacterium GWF2_38_335]OFY78220.1 MAG: hypothetical protein A2281_04255 [Bacteroidetes bacterium RIFOXYA12_FULL_38_20]
MKDKKQTVEKGVKNIEQEDIDNVTSMLVEKYGDAHKDRIKRGVTQAAALWNSKDGCKKDFEEFCLNYFIADEKEREMVFNKISTNFEILRGNFNKMSLDLKRPLHLDIGETHPIDDIFGALDPSAHMESDLYENKVAFIVILNFPFYSLKEKTEMGEKWSRKDWAYARLGDMFTARIPAELYQNYSKVTTDADTYISEYNIFMGKLVNDKQETLFPEDLKLITHWGLRDELKSNYNMENGLVKQKMVYEVMKRIITQEIPKNVINNGEYTWNPTTNKIYVNGKEADSPAEDNVRYQHMLNIFHALKAMDEFSPQLPSYILRKFEAEMEIPMADVEKLFVDLVSSPQVKEVAAVIKKRLGRELEPFDIWFDGFKSRSSLNENDLNKATTSKYPNPEALKKDLPNILVKLGWSKDRAELISSRVAVDPSRGAGHAWGAEMKGDVSHLRTRIGANGMDYKGYCIAVHEFGHNVEQTITLYDVDYYAMKGVPNTAFTEAVAFMFQKRDVELLGMKTGNDLKADLEAIDNFWACYEIMGVSLVDMAVWKWLYEHPDATASDLKETVIRISKEVWNKYYADVFGVKDQPILAIYSHMIDAPLYLSAYPIGHLIDFQLESYIKGKSFSGELERVLKQGRLIPQKWMKDAVGEELSIKPLLEATSAAAKKL